jgi:hypothetical protein
MCEPFLGDIHSQAITYGFKTISFTFFPSYYTSANILDALLDWQPRQLPIWSFALPSLVVFDLFFSIEHIRVFQWIAKRVRTLHWLIQLIPQSSIFNKSETCRSWQSRDKFPHPSRMRKTEWTKTAKLMCAEACVGHWEDSQCWWSSTCNDKYLVPMASTEFWS